MKSAVAGGTYQPGYPERKNMRKYADLLPLDDYTVMLVMFSSAT